MTKNNDDALTRVLQATSAEELFDKSDMEGSLRRWQRLIHPDLNPTRADEASRAFARLMTLYHKFTQPAVSFTTPRGTWTLGRELWVSSGVRYRELEGEQESWVAYVSNDKVTKNFIAGHGLLRELRDSVREQEQSSGGNGKFFFPLVRDSFKLGAKQQEARVLSCEVPHTCWFPLSAWETVHARDIAWIARRALVALELVHSNGLVHGSPHLNAIIIEPKQHGLMLKDWHYSVRIGEPLTLIDVQARDAYPSHAKSSADASVDIAVLAHGFELLCSRSSAPSWLTQFFSELRTNSHIGAKGAFTRLTQLLDSHWERQFHVMEYPSS